MKTTSIVFFCILFITSGFENAFGQEQADTLTPVLMGSHVKYMFHGRPLSRDEAISVLNSNPAAAKEAKAAASNQVFADVFGYIGGFMIGWSLGSYLFGGEELWALGGAGLALGLISLPLESGSKKRMNNAIDIYNDGLRTTASRDKLQLRCSLSGNGVGLKLTF